MTGLRFAVLGSNSFTGSHFVDALLEGGHEVLGLSRSPEPAGVFLPYRWTPERSRRFTFRQIDLNLQLDELAQALDDARPDYLVNFAAQSMVAQSWQQPAHWFQTNVIGIVKLCEHLRKANYLKRYVHVSTPEVYGSFEGRLAENTHYNPSTPYATSRAAADLHLSTLHRTFGFPVLLTRAANVFGPGQQLYRIIPRTILCILTGRKLSLDGGGRSLRSFIHVRDVCEGTLQAALRGEPPAIYHLSTDRVVTVREVVELICSRMSASFAEVVEIKDDRPGKDLAYVLDSAKARRELDWTDRVSLEAGVDATIGWARANLASLQAQTWDYVHKP